MRRLLLLCVLALLAAPSLTASAQDDEPTVDVIVVSGPLDETAVDFVIEAIEDSAAGGAEAAVLQVDSPAVVERHGNYARLLDLVADPPVPLAVWVGPAPARAFGEVVELAAAAPLRFAAPGAEIGWSGALDDRVVVDSPIPGLVDELVPTISQLIQSLDGRTVTIEGAERTLATIQPAPTGEGVTTITVVVHQPGFWDRFLRLAVTPEAAFLFLMAGLTVAAFELYAIGPGLAAATAGLSLFLAAYGISVLPIRWWALALAILAWGLLTASYQMGGAAVLTTLAAVVLAVGGLWFVDGAPQLVMNPAVTLLVVAAVLAFYLTAMPVVARSRFSTRTVGRHHLVGQVGTAAGSLSPEGEVEVAGARWRAAGHREAGIGAGDTVRIVAVDGTVLEVEPVRENEA